MRYLTALTIFMGVGTVPYFAAANNACSIDMYEQADASLVSAARGWGSLSKHQKAFASCDDGGALAEGYSEAVVRLLAYRWDEFAVFAALSKRNPAFHLWAVRHIDASVSADDLKRVVRNAAKCTGSAKIRDLCGEVGQAASDALKD